MPTLPTNSINLSSGVQFEQQPSLTWGIDQTGQRIRGTVDQYPAVRQAVEILVNVERFRWQIYQPYTGMQWEGLVGQDPGYVAAEMQRRLQEALSMDDRVLGITAFDYVMSDDQMTAVVNVSTVYGDVETELEVTV